MIDHYIQYNLIKKISLSSNVKFADLTDLDIESNLLSYHLKKLITQGLVEKKQETYQLSDPGKILVNHMNIWDQNAKMNQEPKVSVKIHVFAGDTVESKLLAVKRLKEPYYGFYGAISGSLQFGLGLETAARKILSEKTGLTSSRIENVGFCQVINSKAGEIVDDKIFHLFNMFMCEGDLLERENYEYKFMSPAEFLKLEKIHYGEAEVLNEIIKGNQNIKLQLQYNIQEF